MTKIFRPILFVYWGILTFLALMPAPQSEPLFPFIDKVAHFLSFLILIFLFDKSFKKPITLKSLGLLFCYGLFIELLQSLTTTRSPEIIDLLADALGLLVYFFFTPKLKGGSQNR